MNPLHLCIALSPLAIYMLFLAYMNYGTRPRVLNSFRDLLAVGFGTVGLAIAGPLELFLPESAAFRFGPYSWVMLLILYALTTLLILLCMRPRLVIYNATAEELRPILAMVVQQMDAQSRWAGDGVAMPQSGIHFHLDRAPSMRNVQLVASGNDQDYQSWSQLERRLRVALRKAGGRVRNQNSALFLMLGVVLLVIVTRTVFQEHATMAHSLRELLRM